MHFENEVVSRKSCLFMLADSGFNVLTYAINYLTHTMLSSSGKIA